MVYYKGGVSYEQLNIMSLPELIELIDNAKIINEAAEREAKRAAKR